MRRTQTPAKAYSMQALASAILAPSLRHVADSLALHWRKQLTAVTHKRYLQRINFYTVSNFAGMQVRLLLLFSSSRRSTCAMSHWPIFDIDKSLNGFEQDLAWWPQATKAYGLISAVQ